MKKNKFNNNPNYRQYLKLKEKELEKFKNLIKENFEPGETPMTFTQIHKELGLVNNITNLSKALNEVFGYSMQTRIDGIQGKYYFLKLKDK